MCRKFHQLCVSLEYDLTIIARLERLLSMHAYLPELVRLHVSFTLYHLLEYVCSFCHQNIPNVKSSQITVSPRIACIPCSNHKNAMNHSHELGVVVQSSVVKVSAQIFGDCITKLS
jgi:DNA-directed RNA polymerase subunit RPC12/RpoP